MARKSNGSVLIVDRDSDLVAILSSYLLTQGYKAIFTNRVREALRKMQNQKFTHIFMDPQLAPDDEALIFEEVMRTDSQNAKTPVTLMTLDLEYKISMVNVKRLHSVIRKPFGIGEFATRLASSTKVAKST